MAQCTLLSAILVSTARKCQKSFYVQGAGWLLSAITCVQWHIIDIPVSSFAQPTTAHGTCTCPSVLASRHIPTHTKGNTNHKN
eukprot:6190943-Pleurochrysis_carterae.AAC.3